MSPHTQPVSRDWRERRARYLARTGRAPYPAAPPAPPQKRRAPAKPNKVVYPDAQLSPAPVVFLLPCWICQSTGQCRHRELGLARRA